MYSPWMLLAPLIVAAAAALVALLIDAMATPRAGMQAGAAGLALAAAGFAATSAFQPVTAVFGLIALGGAPALVDAVVCGLGAVALAAGGRLSRAEHAGQVASLVAFSAAASCLLVSAADLGIFVVALELVGLTGYAMVAASRTKRSYEAAMKYFVQGAIATALLLFGVAILFGAFGGALDYRSLGDSLAAAGTSRALVTALVLLMSALAFKLGAFPFHSWAPDAYETAPAPVTAFLATAPKLAALVALLALLMSVLAGQVAIWRPLVAALAVGSIAFGNLGALKQTSFRRMLAYSGIAQVGYAFVGVAAGASPAVLLFGVSYAVAAGGAFLAAAVLEDRGGWDGSIAGLAGVGRARPLFGASLAVCLLSLTGIPLTVGFWGKLLAFAGAAGEGMLWLAIVGVLGSVVSFGYYGGVLRALYLDEGPAGEPEPATAETEPLAELDLAPRSVGAMAADDAAGTGRVASVALGLIAGILLLAGVLPLFGGLGSLLGLLQR